LLCRGSVSGDDRGSLSLWQVAKDLGLILMGMSRRGASDSGLSGAVVAQPVRRAVLASTLGLGPAANAAAVKLDGRAGASTRRPGLAFAMTGQAEGT